MRKALIGLVVASGLVTALWAVGTWELPIALAFGWVVFLFRVVPRMSVDWPGVGVSMAAGLLFAVGLQWLASRWVRWKVRWTMLALAAVVLMFTAGLATIALVHQAAWAARDGRPLFVEEERSYRYEGSTFYLGASRNNLRMIGLSTLNHASIYHDTLPAGGTFSPAGEGLHSWETYILPYLPYQIHAIDLKAPWNGPRNERHFRGVIPTFVNPDLRVASLRDADGFGISQFAANVEVMGVNRGESCKTGFADGASNTILIGEVNSDFKAWGNPTNFRSAALGLNRSPHGFGGVPGAGGVRFVMADGSVRFVGDRIAPAVIRALGTPGGGEEIDASVLQTDW